MLFSSTVFLFCFLPFVSLCYWAARHEIKNYILLLSSLFFYAWGEPKYISIMLLVIGINYIVGILLETAHHRKKILVGCGIVANLVILFFFKYTNFFVENINVAFNFHITPLNIIMPIGISFFTFQSISYIIDVYRNEVKPQRDITKLALYVSLFPQLIAGPIVKYHDIEANIDNRNVNIDDVACGIQRFIVGLSKKVLIANILGKVADSVYATGPNGIDAGIAWLGAIAYTMQIFFDFSGYSDMAIGLGKIFGFHFLENFNYPYISTSITEFWRRWHISLSTWFKEYLYIPLGGNRAGTLKTYRNLFLVFLATGFWHGASWNFIVWGLWHGLFIILEKRFRFTEAQSFTKRTILHFYTILVFVIGWVFFRAEDLSTAIRYIQAMFGAEPDKRLYSLGHYLSNQVILTLIIAIILSCNVSSLWKNKEYSPLVAAGQNIGYVVLLFLAIVFIASSTYNPFIYFRF